MNLTKHPVVICQPVKTNSPTLPIVILKPVKPSGLALASFITFTNDMDTLRGQTTSNNPEFYLQFTTDGQWQVTIASQGYKTVNEENTYVDSFYYRVDTLQDQ